MRTQYCVAAINDLITMCSQQELDAYAPEKEVHEYLRSRCG